MGGAVIVFILEVMEALIKGMGLPWYVVGKRLTTHRIPPDQIS